jgi:hypothetical protein
VSSSNSKPRKDKCPSCGAALCSIEDLQDTAWQALRGRSPTSKGCTCLSGRGQEAQIRVSGPAYTGVDDLRPGEAAKNALLWIVCELAHRSGRCTEDVLCPGSFYDIGLSAEALIVGPDWPCPICLSNCEVLEDGRICPHSFCIAKPTTSRSHRTGVRESAGGGTDS